MKRLAHGQNGAILESVPTRATEPASAPQQQNDPKGLTGHKRIAKGLEMLFEAHIDEDPFRISCAKMHLTFLADIQRLCSVPDRIDGT
jgi:hypothetical protein